MRQQSDLNYDWQLVETQQQFDSAVNELAAGCGPLYVDTERASGFTYYNRAYLVQIGRKGAPNFLIDPLGITDFSALAKLFAKSECVLHAASQDLPCLSELGLVPQRLWDTELAARLLGFSTASLGGLCELLLDLQLEKAYSGVDWSTRPLADEWLEYACLDVVVLPELHSALSSEAAKQMKTARLTQEFAHALAKPPKPPKQEPWRRIKGLNTLELQRSRVIALTLSLAREEFAREHDIAPSRVLSDSSIIAAARAMPRSLDQLVRLRGFQGLYSKTEVDRWWQAILRAKKAPLDTFKKQVKSQQQNSNQARTGVASEFAAVAADAPAVLENSSIPPQVQWQRRNPEALNRLQQLRKALDTVAKAQSLELWLLLDPQSMRELCWQPAGNSVSEVTKQLQLLGAREWQIALVAPVVSEVFSKTVAK